MNSLLALEHNRHAVLSQQKVMQGKNYQALHYNNGFEYGVKHVLSPKSGLLIDILLGILEISRDEFLAILNLGGVYFEGERLRTDREISEGDYIRVHTKPRRFPANNYNWSERILFENKDFLIVNKPPGLPVHPSVDNFVENLQTYLSSSLQQELFITHRLDVPTQGLLVLAKNKNFLSQFNQLLIQRAVQKIYRARVQGQVLTEGLFTHYMEPSPRAPKVVRSEAHPQWQECQLRIFDLQNFVDENEQELRVELLTGRTHQIRAQLSALGAPICGDVMYGGQKKYDLEQIDLEAESLKFLEFEFTLRR